MADARKGSVQDLSTQQQRSTTTSQPQRRAPGSSLQRYSGSMSGSPFDMFRRLSDEMDRWFDRTLGYSGAQREPAMRLGPLATPGLWAPRIEAFQRGDEFIVRAELPGLKKDDVRVNITDDSLIIEGERRDEFENTHGDVFHSERSYGSFYREVPLPDGAIGEQANASFNNGVLEVKLKAPPNEVRRGRSVEIK